MHRSRLPDPKLQSICNELQILEFVVTRHPVDNAHRVLRADGTIAPGFHGLDVDRTARSGRPLHSHAPGKICR
ncbi:MAG: hypothetical protein WBV74_09735, partial [Pseudonocardiaceae bacterium]